MQRAGKFYTERSSRSGSISSTTAENKAKTDPGHVHNWPALRAEERWWRFGMTAMSTGSDNDGNKGWRLALRHALGDVAQSDPLQPKGRRLMTRPVESLTLDLFDNIEQSDIGGMNK